MHEIRGATWDDLRFPAQGINPPGAASDPDVETNTGLLLFAGNRTEIVAGVAQMPHTWVEGTEIRPHVHWTKTTSAAGTVQWDLDYEVGDVGEDFAFTYGSNLSNDTPAVSDGDTSGRHALTALGDITMTGKKISTIIIWKLSRVGGSDTYGADARLLEFDIHYLFNKGSGAEFQKYA